MNACMHVCIFLYKCMSVSMHVCLSVGMYACMHACACVCDYLGGGGGGVHQNAAVTEVGVVRTHIKQKRLLPQVPHPHPPVAARNVCACVCVCV